jgi:hypothetical protein
VNNKGLEVSLGFEENNAKGIGYFINASASYAHNKIEYMAEAQRPFAYLNRTGQSIGQPFGLQAIGFFKDEAEIAASPRQTFAPVKPGDIKYKDQNGDGIIDIYDEVAIGKPSIAAWTFGLHTGIRFKGLSLEAFFQGATGRSVMLQGPLVWAFVNDAKAAPLALGRWTPETAATATYPRLTTTANDNNYRASDFWQRNGNFLRLRNVELGYTLPAKVSKIVSLQQTYLYVNAVNLFTIDAVKLTDPEVLIGYPVMKSVNIGIRVQM